jgi:tetratricopeptide (TPR) repeat protein/tRNA A-37 threonylcarbamoyl transferase component Bud32
MADDQATRPISEDDPPSGEPSSLKGLTMALGFEPAEPGHDPLLGCDIGGVTIERLIAEGGMGRVYEAAQEKPKRTVAVKVMRPGLTSPSILRRFEYEAEVLGRLRHPGIAHIYSVGVHQMGNATVPYFLMEYIADARTLTTYANELKLPVRQRLGLFRSVCDAVAHGHQKGVIHRDLKPSNILVDASGQPKVIDFGVARATDSDMALTTMQTDMGQLIGTLQYMSPEQFKADPNDIDVRSDVYALGVILYELLVGRPPYDLKKKALHEVARIVQEDDPTPLPAFEKTLQGDVALIAGKCLQKDRSRRYSSASELAVDVSRFLAGEPIAAAPPSFWDSLHRVARRHRAAAAAVAGIAASLVAAVIGVSVFAIRAERAREEATAARDAEEERADQLKRVSDFQARMLATIDVTTAGRGLMADIRERFGAALEKAGVPEAEREERAETFAGLIDRVNATDAAAAMIDRTILAPAIKAIDAEFTNDPETDASLRQALASVYFKIGIYEAAVGLEKVALATRRQVLGEQHPDTLTSISTMGSLLLSHGKVTEAESLFREALEKRRRLLGEEHPDTLTSISTTGLALLSNGKPTEAESLFREVLDKRRRVLGEEHPDTLASINHMGSLLETLHRHSEAEPFYREALEKHRLVLGEEHPDTLAAIRHMGGLLIAKGSPSEAEPFIRETLEKSSRVLGQEHPNTLTAVHNMGVLLMSQGKFPEAESFLREALEKRRRLLGEEHPDTITSILHLGALLTAQKKLPAAELLWREALEKRRRVLGEEHRHTLASITWMGWLLASQGKPSEAELFYREAHEKLRREMGDEHPKTLALINTIGGLLEAQNKLVEAESIYAEGIAICRRASEQPPPVVAVLLRNSAKVLGRLGKFDEAWNQAQQAVTMYHDHPDWPAGDAERAAEVLAAIDTLIETRDIETRDAEATDRQSNGTIDESSRN